MDMKSRLTALEKENQHLQKAMGKVKTMLDNNQSIAHIGSWEWDIQSGEVIWTDELYRILGFKPGEIKPDYDTSMSFIHPDDKAFAEKSIQKAIDEGKIYHIENRVIRKDGSIGYVISKGTVFFDKKKNAVSMAGTIQDVTERKMLEIRIQNAQKLESLGVIAGGIAHDFNNLLAIIIGNAELAQMHQPTESKAQHFINTIVASAHRGADLCDQMFAYAGKQNAGRGPTDLNKIISEMAHLLDVSILKTEIIYDLEPKLPPIEANMTQIRQVILNLITNASESFEDKKGHIRIKTGCRWFNEQYFASTFIDNKLTAGDYVFLEVTDTGSGISKDIQNKIFDPFFSTKFSGRGLGLAAVLGIVKSHDGAISLTSNPGHGTRITILFRISKDEEQQAKGKKSGRSILDGSGTILVVDDEKDIQYVAQKHLESVGYNVLTASDGAEALRIYRDRSRDITLVILDMYMPGLGGNEVYQKLLKINSKIKVILCSGYEEQNTRKKFPANGLAGFIRKPFLRQELLSTVDKVINP